MVVSHFGVRAVVDKGGETCDQGGVCRQSDGKHVTRAGFSTEGLLGCHCFICKIRAILHAFMHAPWYSPSSVIADGVGWQSGGGGGDCG